MTLVSASLQQANGVEGRALLNLGELENTTVAALVTCIVTHCKTILHAFRLS